MLCYHWVGWQIHDAQQLWILKELLHYCVEREEFPSYMPLPLQHTVKLILSLKSENTKVPWMSTAIQKQQFDNYVRRLTADAAAHNETLPQIVGFRYFNVYGPREQHKGSMASVAFHLNNQMNAGENPKLFWRRQNLQAWFCVCRWCSSSKPMVPRKRCFKVFST